MNKQEIASLIDISSVKTTSDLNSVDQIIDAAIENSFICVFPNPCFLDHTISRLKEYQEILVGGVVGFPSGSETTTIKVLQAKENIKKGCDEIDMVLNIGKLKSGLYDDVLADVNAVCKAVGSTPLKVIIETPLLSENEIRKACEILLQTDITFVKTGTGWSGATTLNDIEIITSVIQGKKQIKVAGGVRDLETLKTMVKMGVTRFGIGKESAINIINNVQQTTLLA